MEEAEIPPNEVQRLHLLYRYHVLDTAREEAFDELADLAASICEAPIALITFIDKSRQWFKARIGLDVSETARSVSFCAHAILQPGLFIVPDTQRDRRFFDNPFVIGPPNIRFYAGAPLFTDEGIALGTICVVDRVPRSLSPEQQRCLGILRTHVLKLLELRQKTHELEELNRELETYTYTVSHDLKSPLRAISGFGTILLEDHVDSLGDDAQNLVARIREAAGRMQKMTDELLFLTRISRTPLTLSRTNLSKIASEIVSELRKANPERQAEIEIESELIVTGDPNLLRLVMGNLLSNAWKFTSKREKAIIKFGKETSDQDATFFVKDNGTGFEMAYVKKLFEPFQRLHPGSDFGGTGVGLATVKRILIRHNGRIWADACIDKGATFRFVLPSQLELIGTQNET